MTDNTPSVSLMFKLKLDSVAFGKDDLIKLAKETIDVSHDHRTFSEREGRDLIVNPTSIKVGATVGMGRAIMNKNLSTNDKLYMIMNKYISLVRSKNPLASEYMALDSFRKDFAKKYPEEFGVKNCKVKQRIEANQILQNKMMVGQYHT